MASTKDTQRVISGTLKLLAPADKISESDAVAVDNWRVDTDNLLRSRKGSTHTGNVGGASGPWHTLRKVGVYRLAGIGTQLYGGAVPTGLFADQLDGQPLGMAFYQSVPIVPFSGQTSQGVAWIMNRARQLRLSQTEAFKWGVDAPTTDCVAVSEGAASVSLEEFTGAAGTNNVSDTPDGATWIVDMLEDVPQSNGGQCTASFDNTLAVSGNALQMLMGGPGSVADNIQIGSLDTTVAGQINDEDQFTLELYLSDPSQITSFAISLTDANGATLTCPVVPNTTLTPANTLNQAAQAWTSLTIRRTVNVDAFMSQIQAASGQTATDLAAQLTLLLQQPYFNIIAGRDPSSIGITTPLRKGVAFDWTKVASAQVSFVCAGAVEIELSAFECVGGAGSSLTGSGQYYVTFFNEVLQEGNPSPNGSAPITVNGDIVTLENVPIWSTTDYNPNTYGGQPSAQVRGRYVYRTGFGLSAPLRVGTIWDNTTTTWTDNTTNATAQDDDFAMPTQNNLPPPARGCIGPIFGKIIAFNTDAHPARYFWTTSAEPWYFPGSDDDASGNWEDAGGDDDAIVNATAHKQLFVLYKQRSIWRVPGDPDTADAERTSAAIGLVGPNAVVNGGEVDYMVGPEGFYVFNMDVEQKLSADIDPIFKGDPVQLSNGEWIPPIEPTAMATIAVSLVTDRARICYPELGNSEPNVTLLFHIPTGRWSREKYATAGAFSAMNWDGPGALMGASGADLYQLEQNNTPTDAGSPIHVLWQTRYFDQNLPDIYKHYSDIEVDFQTAGEGQSATTLSVYIVYNNGTKVLLDTISSAVRTTTAFSLRAVLASYQPAGDEGLLAKNIAIRVEGDATSECTIFGAYIHWYPEERLAVTFDTGFTNFGMPDRVKQVDYIEYYQTATGATQVRNLYSDLPGRILTQRLSETVAAPVGRGTIRGRLPSVVEGRNFRWTWGNSNPFQMHAVRARMRPIGDYIDGTNGEYYESAEFSIAPGRVGELKDFLLDYDVSGPGGSLELFTDLPGAALSVRRTLPIPYQTTGRNIYVFPFESPQDDISDFLPNGQLFKVRLYPPPGGILRLHGRAVFRGRVIGVYFNGANGEVFQTQPIDLCGGMGLFREISMIAGSPGTISINFETQLEGGYDMATAAVLVSPPTRTPAFFRLPGNTKGILQRVTVSSTDVCRLWEVKVLSRKTQLNAGGWDWLPIPMDPTGDQFAEIAMPVGQTAPDFEWIEIPVDSIN